MVGINLYGLTYGRGWVGGGLTGPGLEAVGGKVWPVES